MCWSFINIKSVSEIQWCSEQSWMVANQMPSVLSAVTAYIPADCQILSFFSTNCAAAFIIFFFKPCGLSLVRFCHIAV